MTLDLNPRTKTVAAATIKAGHIVLESREHPAQVTRIAVSQRGLSIYCRYIWQASSEREWRLGTFKPHAPIEKAVR